MDSARRKATAVLERLRRTPMHRGALPRLRAHVKDEIAKEIEAQGIATALARRFAFQMAVKLGPEEWGDRAVWIATGQLLCEEVVRLSDHVGLSDRQIDTALPKLSAKQVEQFVRELGKADRTIVRTILNAAIDAADPLTAGRRFLQDRAKQVTSPVAPAPPTLQA